MTQEQIDHDPDLSSIAVLHDTVRDLKKKMAAMTSRTETAERRGTILETALKVAQKEIFRLRDECDHATQAHAGIMASLKGIGAITLDALNDAKNRGYNGVLLQDQKSTVETAIPAPLESTPARMAPRPVPAPRPEPVVVRNIRTELSAVGIDLNRKAVG